MQNLTLPIAIEVQVTDENAFCAYWDEESARQGEMHSLCRNNRVLATEHVFQCISPERREVVHMGRSDGVPSL